MRKLKVANSLIALLIAASFSVRAQDSKAAIRDGLVAKYALTKPTADKTDIVTAGAVLVLQKDDLMTVGVSNPNPYQIRIRTEKSLKTRWASSRNGHTAFPELRRTTRLPDDSSAAKRSG